MIILKTHFFLLLYQIGTSLTSTLETQQTSITFKKKLLNFIRPCPNSIFDIHNPIGKKLLTRLHLGFSHLHEHKFRHCFQDTLNPLCEFGKDIESTMHFFLHCTNFLIPRQNHHSSLKRLIIISTIEYLISTERFKCSLLD